MRRGFTIHHNGPPARCVGRDHLRCIGFWAAVKHYHVNTRGWSDIAYSFGVCPHGTRFEGRGWIKSQWANGDDVVGPDNGRDREWFTVLAFIGEDATVVEEPTPEMVEGLRALIAQGRNQGYCGLEVLPHNAFKVKKCPGDTLTAFANRWNNNDLLDTQEDDLDMDDDHFKGLVRDVLNEGTGAGQKNWASTCKADLAVGQANLNATRAVGDPDALADAITQRLVSISNPAGRLTKDDVADAVRSVFAELGDG